MKTVLIVAQNPSPRSASVRPFQGAKSKSTLLSWLDFIGAHEYHIVNASNKRGKVSIEDAVELPYDQYDAVIALGNFATAALSVQGCEDFYIMPHPSGLNRQLNSTEYVEKRLAGARAYVELA